MELEAMSDLNHTPGSFAAVGDIASMCDRPPRRKHLGLHIPFPRGGNSGDLLNHVGLPFNE